MYTNAGFECSENGRSQCQTCGTSLFLFDEDEPGVVALLIATIATPNAFDFVELTEHIWLEDTASLVLDQGGKGGGLAGVMNDGLPRQAKGRSSPQW